MKNLLAAATIVAILALAPAALATPYGPQGYRSITDTPGGNARTAQADTSTTAPNAYQNTGSASAALQGYTTSGPARTHVAIVATGGSGFNWGDAGIGAVGAIGMTLVLIGGSLVVLRRRSRPAV